jgi:hypothetical protein
VKAPPSLIEDGEEGQLAGIVVHRYPQDRRIGSTDEGPNQLIAGCNRGGFRPPPLPQEQVAASPRTRIAGAFSRGQ